MDTKLGKVLTLSEKIPPLKPNDTSITWSTWGHLTIWKICISSFTKLMTTILGTLPRYKRYVKHVNFQRLLVSSRLNLRPINHKERYFISWHQFHSTSNIFCQQWNNIIHHLRNASTHHVLRFFSIHKRYHRLDLTRGSKPDAVGKWELKTTNQGWSLKTLSQAYLEPCQTSKTEVFFAKTVNG